MATAAKSRHFREKWATSLPILVASGLHWSCHWGLSPHFPSNRLRICLLGLVVRETPKRAIGSTRLAAASYHTGRCAHATKLQSVATPKLAQGKRRRFTCHRTTTDKAKNQRGVAQNRMVSLSTSNTIKLRPFSFLLSQLVRSIK